MIWRCPTCRGELVESADSVACAGCGAAYEAVCGIPDLRIDAPSWIDCDDDRAQARHIAATTAGWPLDDVLRHVFRMRGLDAAGVERRVVHALDAPHRLRGEVEGWLTSATSVSPFLDLGCGSGALLAAAHAAGRPGIGVDVSMVWLVVAKRRIEAAGGVPVLAAGFAEALPLADDALSGVVSLDTIEHVGDQAAYLREIDRVTAPGGAIALATPNRFSLGPEPHVRVWGVGWLPRRVQRRYAEWRSGLPYAFTRLLSTPETRRLMRRHTHFDYEIVVPPIPDEEVGSGSTARATLARVYNRVVAQPWVRPAMLLVGAFFRIVGRKIGAAPMH